MCQAILLCDSLYREQGTGKTALIGIFDTFVVESLPGHTSRCLIFLRMVDAIGRFAISAEIRDTERGLVLFRSPDGAKFGNPKGEGSGEMSLPLAPLEFQKAGRFDLVVFANGAEIARARFSVTVQTR